MRPPLVLLAGTLALGLAAAAWAQSIGDEQRALAQAKRDGQAALARAAGYERQADDASDAAAKAQAQADALSSEIDAAEADIAAARARVRIVAALTARRRAALAIKQQPIARLTGALETMARRPPALALVQPGSIADIVHVRALMATMLPAIRARTTKLRAAAAEADRLAALADQAVQTLRDGQAHLAERRAALAVFEQSERDRSQRFTDSAMHEQDRALAMGEQARDIVDQMHDTEERGDVSARLATLPGPLDRPGPRDPPAPHSRVYRLPVTGQVVTGLGELADAGYHARGLTLATASQALVRAPADGRIAYAGPFRSYGRIVIVDHGGGWTTLVSGLGTTDVALNQRVARGVRLGSAPATSPKVTIELRRGARPIDIVSLIGG